MSSFRPTEARLPFHLCSCGPSGCASPSEENGSLNNIGAAPHGTRLRGGRKSVRARQEPCCRLHLRSYARLTEVQRCPSGLSGQCVLSESVGFVFDTERASQDGAKEASAPTRYTLIYTGDGGIHWSRPQLPRPVYDCQVFEGALRCRAGCGPSAFGVLTVDPKRRRGNRRAVSGAEVRCIPR